MGKNKVFGEIITTWSTQERVAKAKERVEDLTYRIQEVLELHAANEIIQYSNQLSSQIPESRAANAFNTFQDAMFRQEVIRLLSLWDTAAENAVSIPAIIALIDDDDVVDALQAGTYDAHANQGFRNFNPSNDPDIQQAIDKMFVERQQGFAVKQAELAAETLKACIREAGEMQGREKTASIKNLRDHLAHSVAYTRREKKKTIPPAQYGDEKELFELTSRLIEDLYCWVNGTSFDISGNCMDQARRCANELWMNCRFEFV